MHQFVAVHVRQTDVDDDHVVGVVPGSADHAQGFRAVVGRFDHAAVAIQQGVGGAADVLVGVDHQHPPPAQYGPLLDVQCRRMGLGRGHLLADLLDHLFNIAGVAEDALQALDHFRLVTDVALHDIARLR